MSTTLRALGLGTLAAGLLSFVLAAAIAVGASSGGLEVRAAVGPVLLVSVWRDGATAVSTLGPGLAVIAVLGGVLNAVAAVILSRRGRTRRATL